MEEIKLSQVDIAIQTFDEYTQNKIYSMAGIPNRMLNNNSENPIIANMKTQEAMYVQLLKK